MGEAFIRLVPSFRGLQESIDREAAKWGASAGAAYRRAFEDEAKRGQPPVPGPSDEESRRKGEQAGRKFGDGFKAGAESRQVNMRVNVITGPAMSAIGQVRRAIQDLAIAAAGVQIGAAGLGLLGPTAAVGLGGAGFAAVLKPALTKVDAAAKLQQAAAAQSPAQQAALDRRAASAQAAADRAQAALGPKATAAQRQRAAQLQQQAAQARQAAAGPTASQQKANAAMAALSPQERELARSQAQLKASFTDWARSLESVVLPVVDRAMRLVGPFLHEISPLVTTLSRSVGQVLSQVGQGMKSAGLDRFVFFLNSLIGPAVRTVAAVITNIGSAAGSAMRAMGPLTGAVEKMLTTLTGNLAKSAQKSGLGAFFKTITATMPTLTRTLGDVGRLLGTVFATVAPLAKPVLTVVDSLAQALTQLLRGLGPSLTAMFRQLVPPLTQLISALLPPLASIIKAIAGQLPQLVTSFVDLVKALLPLVPLLVSIIKWIGPILRFIDPLLKFAPIILGIVAAVRVWAVVQKALNLVLTANPIMLVISALAALGVGLYLAWEHSKTFRDIVKEVLHAVTVAFFDTWHAIDAALHWIEGAWHTFAGFTSRIWGDITHGVSSVWDGMISGLKTAWHDVSSWLTGVWKGFVKTTSRIWGDITGGIKSAFGSVESFFKGVWGRVVKIFEGAVSFVERDIINPLIGVVNAVLRVFGLHIDPIGSHNGITSWGPGGGGSGGSASWGPNPVYGTPSSHGGRAFALGGVEPGYAPGQDTRWVRVSPGEGFIVPEAVRGLGGEAAINAINAAFSPRVRGAGGGGRLLGGVPHFALGGVLQHLEKLAVQAFTPGGALLTDPNVAYRALGIVESPIRATLDHLAPASFAAKLAHGVFDKINNAIRAYIKSHMETVYSGRGISGAGLIAIWRNLRAVGMSPAMAAGVMGNMWAESGFNPNIIQGGGASMNPAAAGGGGYGLVQWTPGAKLIPYLHGAAPTIQSEIQALAAQLSGLGPSPESAAGRALRAATTATQAANVFGLQYERYAGPPQADRAREAEQIYAQYAGRYDSGGWLPPGVTAAFNNTGRPELVLTAEQVARLSNRDKGPMVQQVINPSAHQSEFEIASIAAHQIDFLIRSR